MRPRNLKPLESTRGSGFADDLGNGAAPKFRNRRRAADPMLAFGNDPTLPWLEQRLPQLVRFAVTGLPH
jgi:hypothetical protein